LIPSGETEFDLTGLGTPNKERWGPLDSKHIVETG